MSELHREPSLQKAEDGAAANEAACEQNQIYHQLDFWISEWEVFGPEGKGVGMNPIEKVAGGCLRWENWTGSSGSERRASAFTIRASRSGFRSGSTRAAGGSPSRDSSETAMLAGEHVARDGEKELFRGVWTRLADGGSTSFLSNPVTGVRHGTLGRWIICSESVEPQ